MKKILALLLALIFMLSCFAGCGETGTPGDSDNDPVESDIENNEPDESDEESEKEEESEELPPEPKSITLLYDDRKPVSALLEKEVTNIEIKDQVVTSKKVNSEESDTAVIEYDAENNRIIAVGTGTAVLVADGEEIPVTVNAAPISILVISGHSLGEGQCGNAAQSVVCEAGQAYSSAGASGVLRADTAGLGFKAETRPKNIDALTTDGGEKSGKQGTDGAIAAEWNKLTGEKIWILNVAEGGSCIDDWQPGMKYNQVAIFALNIVSNILKSEVAAGHYTYVTTMHVNFSSANFEAAVTYGYTILTQWHDGFVNSLAEGCTVDIDGDGEIDTPSAIGYVPLWPSNVPEFNKDEPFLYHRASSKDFPGVFIASDAHRFWITDELVAENFPEINYVTHDGKEIANPTTLKEIDADGVHLNQVGYNAQGQDVAKNLYAYYRTEVKAESVTIYDVTADYRGTAIDDEVTIALDKYYYYAIVPDPITTTNLEFIVDGVIELFGPLSVKATEAGTGTLTIKEGDRVIRTITFTAE